MIETGTLLIQSGAARPECFRAGTENCPPAWMSVASTLTPLQLEAELSRSGWTLFYLAMPLRTRVCGFDPARRLMGALRNIVQMVRAQGCNCVQIEEVATGSLLGIPCVTVSAHPRHLQQGMMFVAQ